MNSPQVFEEQFKHATQLHSQGQLHEAEQIYRSLLQKAPGYAPALQNYAVLHMQHNKFNDAETLLKKIIDSFPWNEKTVINYAICKIKLKKKTEAISVLKEILSKNPDSQANVLLSKVTLTGKFYIEYLKAFHEWLAPKTYVETGVFTGSSITLANENTRAIGIDPEPKVADPLNDNTTIYSLTSDDFFATHALNEVLDNQPVEFAFIDGLHIFEAALQDFINIEKYSTSETVVVFHDCVPLNKITAQRERVTNFWSGDVWKVVLCLKKYRPDLTIFTIPAPPTGLCVVTNLNPQSSVLSENYTQILAEFVAMDYDAIADNKEKKLKLAEADWELIKRRIRN